MLKLLAVLLDFVLHEDEGACVRRRRHVALRWTHRVRCAFRRLLNPLQLRSLARVHCHNLLPSAVEIR